MRPLYDKIPDHLHRFIHDVGNGFLIGASGGTVYHLIRGSHGGGGLAGGARAVRANVPRVAGELGAYFALYCAIETAIFGRARPREDNWRSIAAGAASAAVLSARQGVPAVAGCAVLGTASFTALMGLSWILSEWHNRLILYRDHHRLLVSAVSEPVDVAPRSTSPGVSAGCSAEHVKKRSNHRGADIGMERSFK